MQEKYININKLKVSESLSRFVKDELLKDTNISSDDFWLGFEKTVEELEPKNRQLINFREKKQKRGGVNVLLTFIKIYLHKKFYVTIFT